MQLDIAHPGGEGALLVSAAIRFSVFRAFVTLGVHEFIGFGIEGRVDHPSYGFFEDVSYASLDGFFVKQIAFTWAWSFLSRVGFLVETNPMTLRTTMLVFNFAKVILRYLCFWSVPEELHLSSWDVEVNLLRL